MLTLIRGLPGSGKSTFAAHCASGNANARHVEADSFFVHNGIYSFDPTMLPSAHKACQDAAESFLADGKAVFVANTFTTRAEMAPYYQMAERHGVAIFEVIMNGDFKSVHNVPEHVIARMRARWEF